MFAKYLCSPMDRSRKLKALGTSYKIWSECKETSKEAAHATRVVGAILRRVSMQDFPQAKPPPPPPQTDVRDGSLAILLNNDVQLSPPHSVGYNHSHLFPVMDFSLEFMDVAPIDNVLKESNIVDWVCYTHLSHVETQPSNCHRLL
jgi:hypothetical protein